MSDLRNSISLTDRMSPVLKQVLKAMDSTLSVMRQLDRASEKGAVSKAFKQAEKDIKRADNQLKQLRNHTDLVGKSAKNAEKSYHSMTSSMNSGFSSVAKSSSMFLTSLYSGVQLAKQLASTLSGIMSTSDTTRSQVARMGLFNTSQYSNSQLYDAVFKTAMDTRSDLTDTADLANKLLVAGVFDDKSDPMASIATAGLINKAMIAGGSSSEENARALRQLTQGLASGQLQGDELRSIREQTPFFAKILAEGLSKIDKQFEGIGIGDLKRLGAEGELTSERIVKAMWAMQDQIDANFTSMPKTFGQATTKLRNIWKYFLYMLSDTEGPLGKINAQIWKFVDYLQSPKGLDFLNSVAVGVNTVSTGLAIALDAAGNFVSFLQANVPVAQALFTGLGVAAVSAAVKSTLAWVGACWPILLVIALVGVLTYALLSVGFTIEQIIGGALGTVLFLLVSIWDVIAFIGKFVLGIISAIAIGIIAIGTVFILIVQVIVQCILWVIREIAGFFMWLEAIWSHAMIRLGDAVEDVTHGFGVAWWGLKKIAFEVLNAIAKGIDFIFGSNLASGLEQWGLDLNAEYEAMVKSHEESNQASNNAVDKVWADYETNKEAMYSNPDWDLTDNMLDVLSGSTKLINGIMDFNTTGQDFLDGTIVNPLDAFDTGYNFGSGLIDSLGDTNFGLPKNSVLDEFNPNEIKINGGYLDSIKSDVTINEEDLKLLRDMTARDYLLQLQTITPVAKVTFGDVRETADVNKIVEVIEDMVEQQMATSLVG